MLTRVEKYINFEEILKFTVGIKMSRVKREPDRSMKRSYEEDKFDKPNKRQRLNQRESKLPPLKCNNYTSLNTTHTNILMEIRDKNIVNWPGKLRGNLDLKDKKKYYHFHCDHEHDTKECRMLKDEIES